MTINRQMMQGVNTSIIGAETDTMVLYQAFDLGVNGTNVMRVDKTSGEVYLTHGKPNGGNAPSQAMWLKFTGHDPKAGDQVQPWGAATLDVMPHSSYYIYLQKTRGRKQCCYILAQDPGAHPNQFWDSHVNPSKDEFSDWDFYPLSLSTDPSASPWVTATKRPQRYQCAAPFVLDTATGALMLPRLRPDGKAFYLQPVAKGTEKANARREPPLSVGRYAVSLLEFHATSDQEVKRSYPILFAHLLDRWQGRVWLLGAKRGLDYVILGADGHSSGSLRNSELRWSTTMGSPTYDSGRFANPPPPPKRFVKLGNAIEPTSEAPRFKFYAYTHAGVANFYVYDLQTTQVYLNTFRTQTISESSGHKLSSDPRTVGAIVDDFCGGFCEVE